MHGEDSSKRQVSSQGSGSLLHRFAYSNLQIGIDKRNSGAVMEPILAGLLPIKRCAFQPQHAHNLANPFRCFSTYKGSLGFDE